jgi:transposase
MTEAITEDKAAIKNEQWRERIADQERSGLSVKQFCKEQGLTECTFYAWRKRLRGEGLVRFALVERGGMRQEPSTEASLELVLASGERLRIGAGVEAASLRTVLDVLRG